MCYFKRNDRTAGAPKWTLHIFLIIFGVLMLLSEPVHSQQAGRKQTPKRKCPLPEQELESLIDLLNDIEQQPQEEPEESEESEEELEPESGTPRLDPHCARELKKLREAVSYLQRSYYDLKQSPNTIDERQYSYKQNRYAQQKRYLTTQLEELTKQINSQDRSQLKILRDKIVAVEKKLNETVSKIAVQRQQNVNHFTQLVASNIRNQRIDFAVRNFTTLITYSTDPYGAVVQNVLNAGNAQSTGAMVRFLQKVDFQHRPVLGYDALVDALIARSALRGPIAIDLLKHIQIIILARDGNQQAEALALMKKFKSNAH